MSEGTPLLSSPLSMPAAMAPMCVKKMASCMSASLQIATCGKAESEHLYIKKGKEKQYV